ncbi:MAG: DUF3800 domain-containing protein [Acidobacteriota bacterium]|nr:DUF3800 domain-containing protein [Acidobacteriota bacterium]
MSQLKQKLVCYVDETGQDSRSECFIVVAVVSENDQSMLKEALIGLEQQSKVGAKKWHKLRSPEREAFLELALNAHLATGEIFFGRHQKPVSFFEAMIDTLSNAILSIADEVSQTTVFVDGIDKKKARELTNALREKGIKTQQVRSARDESEPLIRFADRWAGCIRGRIEGQVAASKLVIKAIEIGYLRQV